MYIYKKLHVDLVVDYYDNGKIAWNLYSFVDFFYIDLSITQKQQTRDFIWSGIKNIKIGINVRLMPMRASLPVVTTLTGCGILLARIMNWFFACDTTAPEEWGQRWDQGPKFKGLLFVYFLGSLLLIIMLFAMKVYTSLARLKFYKTVR